MNERMDVLKRFEKKIGLIESRISSGIEKHRKKKVTINIINPEGSQLSGIDVKVKQTSLDFKYGANLFMLDEFSAKEENNAYEEYFSQAFNFATLPFYWRDLEPEKGYLRYDANSSKIYRRPSPDLCLEFCKSKNIEPKAHCLNYPCHAPSWVPTDVKEEKLLLEKRFADLAEKYGDQIEEWEVTNEAYLGWKTHNEHSPLYNEPDFIDWSFETAQRYFPSNKLFINEMQERIWDNQSFYGNRSAYYMLIERAIRHGAKIDGIGMQFHMFHRKENELEMTSDYYDPERIYDVLDSYADFNKPIQITEMTIPAYGYSESYEEIQAQIIRNLYRIWFSHPAVSGIVYWNLVDGFAAAAKQKDMTSGENYYHGGLVRSDFTPKPSYNEITHLFQKEWRTNLDLTTDASGSISFTGFHGNYDLWAAGNKIGTFRIEPESQPNLCIKSAICQ